MSDLLRFILIFVSICTVFYVARKIRKAQMQIADSIFWILLPAILILLSVVPNLASKASELIGVGSTVNFVFLFMIFILLMKSFSLSIKLSQVENKLNSLIQEYALNENDKKNNRDS